MPHLYQPSRLTLVHAVEMGLLEYPVLAPAMAKEAYQEVRRNLLDSGRLLLDRAAATLPADLGNQAEKLCETGKPVDVILEAAKGADLLVMGPRDRGRVAELVLGSVSHQVLAHAPCPLLLVKRPLASPPKRVLVAVEGPEDAEALQQWLLIHPFTIPVDLSITVVVPTRQWGDPDTIFALERWSELAAQAAQRLVDDVVAKLQGPRFRVTGQALLGRPIEQILDQARGCDLLIVGTHGRTGLERVLFGSISHRLTHHAPCPILVVGPAGSGLARKRASA
ncbi:MAG: universal stress protein [Nitrospirales bacterium]